MMTYSGIERWSIVNTVKLRLATVSFNTIFAVKPRPPARVTHVPFFVNAAELKRFRSHSTKHAVYTTLGGWEVFQSCALSSP